MIKRSTLLTFIVLASYPLLVANIIPSISITPFDTETISRFIIPFQFHDKANVPWAVMESTQWDIFRPVYSLSILSDYVLWGTNAQMYHVTDLILSWVCYILVFFLLKRQFGFLTAAIAVCLWAVHPAQPMSLLKMYGRNDRLITLFTVAALSTYDISIRANARKKQLFGLTLLLVVLAVLSKDTGIFYSLMLLPAWSILVRKRSIQETLTSDRFLWLGLFLLTVLFVVLRLLAGFTASIDSEGLSFGLRYFRGLSMLILMALPLPSGWNPAPTVVCTVSALTAGATVFCRKCPESMRFGALAFSVFIFPFPFFWIQETFLWGYTLWMSLWTAGCAVFLYDKYIKPHGKKASFVSLTLLVIILSLSSIWSAKITGHISAPMIEMSDIARYAASSEEGPVYSQENIFNRFPDWRRVNTFCGEEQCKMNTYILELIKVETGNPESVIE